MNRGQIVRAVWQGFWGALRLTVWLIAAFVIGGTAFAVVLHLLSGR